jgi:tetratricopeptide (TPR) repeat protein
MIRLKRPILRFLIGAVAIAAAPFVTAQQAPEQSLNLSVDQMQLAAELNLRNGHVERALAFSDALLFRDPNDITALLVRAHALRILQRYGEAQEAARAASRQAKTDEHKYTAAMLMAQALSSDGKRTRAQFWLRRARGVAPSAQHAAVAAQDFRYVRQRNPWQTNLSFTLAPNSNINNGSARESSSLLYDIFTPLFGSSEVLLGASSQALSGIEAGARVQSRYRFSQTEFRAHDLRLGASYRTYRLTQSARDDLAAEDAERVLRGEAPLNLTGSDFAYGTVQIGYGFRQLRQDRRGEFSAIADIGQTFYGGERYNSFLRAQVGQSYYASRTTKYDFGLSADLREAQRGAAQDTYSIDGGISRKLSSGDGMYLGAALSTATADVERLEYDEVKLRGGYVLGREVMGTALQFGVHTSFRDYDVSPHDPSGRREFEVGADITATFRQIDYMGFNPTVSLNASRTESNIGLYDVNRLAVSFGIASAF